MDDTYTFQCPKCSCHLSLDLDGQITALEPETLQPNQRKGIGGLVTETNVADRFYSHGYKDNQPVKAKMQPLGTRPVPTPEPITPDPALMQANDIDLRERNIK